MKQLSSLLLSCTMLMMGTPALAGEYLVVANGGSGDLSVISVADNVLVGTVPISKTGKLDDVASTPDGAVLFVNVQLRVDEEALDHTGGEVVAVSTRTGEKLWTQSVSGSPHHITVSADGSELFVPIFDGQKIEILDTKTGTIVGTLQGRYGMHTTRLSDDGKTLYAGSIMTGQIYAFDVASRKLAKSLTFSAGEFGGIGVRVFSVSDDDSTIYSQLSGFHGFAVLDTGANVVEQFVRHGDLPRDFEYPKGFAYNVDHGLDLSPDGKMLIASSESTEKAYVYSLNPVVLQKTIPVGKMSKWVVFSKDGEQAYVSNPGDNNVSVISTRSLTETGRIPTGGTGGARMKVIDIPDENIPHLVGTAKGSNGQ